MVLFLEGDVAAAGVELAGEVGGFAKVAPLLVVGEALLADELSGAVGGRAEEQPQWRLVHSGDCQDDLGGAVGVTGLGGDAASSD